MAISLDQLCDCQTRSSTHRLANSASSPPKTAQCALAKTLIHGYVHWFVKCPVQSQIYRSPLKESRQQKAPAVHHTWSRLNGSRLGLIGFTGFLPLTPSKSPGFSKQKLTSNELTCQRAERDGTPGTRIDYEGCSTWVPRSLHFITSS